MIDVILLEGAQCNIHIYVIGVANQVLACHRVNQTYREPIESAWNLSGSEVNNQFASCKGNWKRNASVSKGKKGNNRSYGHIFVRRIISFEYFYISLDQSTIE